MSLIASLRALDQKFPWSFIGFVVGSALGIVGLIVGLYSILHESRARLSFEITSEANILDVRQPLKDLVILFRNQNIQEANLNLRVVTLKVENFGEVDILQGHFDRDDTWGLLVHNGTLIEVRLVASNSDYLKQNLGPQVLSGEMIGLRKVILERGKYFILELLILHPKDRSPEITMTGKIASIDHVIPVRTWLELERRSVWADAYSGGMLVQFVRALSYFFATLLGLLLIAGVVVIVGSIGDLYKRRSRRRRLDAFIQLLPEGKRETARLLAEPYVTTGGDVIHALRRVLKDERLLQRYAKRHSSGKVDVDPSDSELYLAVGELQHSRHFMVRDARRIQSRWLAALLVRRGIIKLGPAEELVIDPAYREVLGEFADYLEKNA